MHKLLGGLKEGLIFVVSAPAGTGKTTLVRMLASEFDCVSESVSFTTRSMRAGEKEGVDYHFISQKEFQDKIREDDFLEYAKVFDHYYGTSASAVEQMRLKGKHVVLVIDTQGAMQLMGRLKAIFIFISPPNLDELKNRLQGRRSESDEAVSQRLSWAKKEIEMVGHYDYHIVNDHLGTAYGVLRSILIAEEHRNRPH